MARKRYKPEEIVAKLRQVDVLVSQGQNMVEPWPCEACCTDIADCCARATSGQGTAALPSAANNSRRPMVTVIRPSRARCVKGTIPRHEHAVLTARHPARAGRTPGTVRHLSTSLHLELAGRCWRARFSLRATRPAQ
jgi:hypothetical protein